ncbi:hypothetical protein [Runella zeae]|uniref:hypothetical protein n=1 Tax=Runella zeae TaxID=94255 RepID=UPI0012F76A88|nr:hypothetical protein [Runella zeae]
MPKSIASPTDFPTKELIHYKTERYTQTTSSSFIEVNRGIIGDLPILLAKKE